MVFFSRGRWLGQEKEEPYFEASFVTLEKEEEV
jgi:hypothetical protein